eukprot:COSAG02_NODE_30370_length_552_cov_1.075055_1_plen_117_part_10
MNRVEKVLATVWTLTPRRDSIIRDLKYGRSLQLLSSVQARPCRKSTRESWIERIFVQLLIVTCANTVVGTAALVGVHTVVAVFIYVTKGAVKRVGRRVTGAHLSHSELLGAEWSDDR